MNLRDSSADDKEAQMLAEAHRGLALHWRPEADTQWKMQGAQAPTGPHKHYLYILFLKRFMSNPRCLPWVYNFQLMR